MKYDRLIIEVLIEAGSDGLAVAKISRHVFNAVNGLFDEADFAAIHKLVRAFLLRNPLGENLANHAQSYTRRRIFKKKLSHIRL